MKNQYMPKEGMQIAVRFLVNIHTRNLIEYGKHAYILEPRAICVHFRKHMHMPFKSY